MSGKRIGHATLALGLLFGLTACNSKTEDGFKTQEGNKTVKEAHVEHHYGPGPHKGMMADLGSDHSMVVELVYAAEPRSITAYVVGHDDQTKPVPLAAKSMTLELHGGASPLTLSAEPQEGDAEGKASKFVVMGDAIPESIKDQEDIEGHVNVTIDGKTLEAEFHHDEEGHDESK